MTSIIMSQPSFAAIIMRPVVFVLLLCTYPSLALQLAVPSFAAMPSTSSVALSAFVQPLHLHGALPLAQQWVEHDQYLPVGERILDLSTTIAPVAAVGGCQPSICGDPDQF